MRKTMIVLAALLLCAAAVQSRADVRELQPGGIHLHGYLNQWGRFQIDVAMNQAETGSAPIAGVKIYSEPSHTLLFVFLDEQVSVALMSSIQGEKPVSMVTGTVGAAVLHIQLDEPAEEDSRIRVEYLYQQGSEIRAVTIADGQVYTVLAFEFSAEPMRGGESRICGYCGGVLCGCVYCTAFTICCPDCTIVCAPNSCPP